MTTDSNQRKPIVIGIAGGTGAGKTTFARSLYAALGGSDATPNKSEGCPITYLSHDDYYKDLSHLPLESRVGRNFDHPSSLDTDLLIHHLKELVEGRSVVVPRYDFSRHCRYQEGELDREGRKNGRVVPSSKIILIEGILILSIHELFTLMDLKVFVDASSDVRLMRRIQRDSVERERSLPDIIAQYSATVRPMHNEFVEPSKRNADLIVNGYDEDETVSKQRMNRAIQVVCNHLKMETGL